MIILSMILLGVITFMYRYSFVSSVGRKIGERIPPRFLQLLAPATFAAIIFNGILASKNSPAIFLSRSGVAVVALMVAYFTRSIFITLIVGLGLLYLYPRIFPL